MVKMWIRRVVMMMMVIGSCLSLTCWLAGPSSSLPWSDGLFNDEDGDGEDVDLVDDVDDGKVGGVPPHLFIDNEDAFGLITLLMII